MAKKTAPYIGKSGTVDLDEKVFGEEFNMGLVHETARAELNARRRGTASTLSRGEVSMTTAKAFRQACQRLGVCQSMGRPGSALDNAVIESWHSTLEFELRRVEHFTTRAQARTRVAAWIDDYNRHRRHSALAMMSPVDYEKTLHAGEAA